MQKPTAEKILVVSEFHL